MELSSGLLLHGRSSGERKLRVLHCSYQLDCVECKMHRCTVLMKDKIVINNVITASNICWYLSNTVHLFSLLCLIRTTPIIDTVTDTVTDLVNIKRDSNILQDAMLLSYVLSGSESIVLTVTSGSLVTRYIFKMCLVCFGVKKHAAFKWKDAISSFLFPR